MPIPDLIEIVPIDRPIQAAISVPGSKSITNRALILAALGEGETTLRGALWSEDTEVMVGCLRELGFMVNVGSDSLEPCNRTITVYGRNGSIPPGGTASNPKDLFVANAGTTARFLSAFLCLGSGLYRLDGSPRMHERPQASLFKALRELGYTIDSENDRLPAIIHGGGLRRGKCTVSIRESSQFASALLLCAPSAGWSVAITGENADEAPYVTMTTKLMAVFPKQGGLLEVEPDASSASYFLAFRCFHPAMSTAERKDKLAQLEARFNSASDIERIADLSAALFSAHILARPVRSGWQVDERFAYIVRECDEDWAISPRGLPATISRSKDLGDSILTAMIVAPFAERPVRFIDLARLRVQECERVHAMRSGLSACGVEVLEHGDTLTVFPSASTVHGAEIETWNDHRIAMCFATLGLKVAGIRIKNPACVKKTFPNFFQKLAAAPPHGLGTAILDGNTGRELKLDELFAE